GQGTNAEHQLKTGVTGKVLHHVAFLGMDQPRIRQLADLPRMVASEARQPASKTPHGDDVLVACMSEPTPTRRPTIPLTLTQRISVAEAIMSTLTARTAQMSEAMGEVRETDARLSFASFVPDEASNDTLGPLDHVLADAAE